VISSEGHNTRLLRAQLGAGSRGLFEWKEARYVVRTLWWACMAAYAPPRSCELRHEELAPAEGYLPR
jgi:hypothetical protein